MRQIDIDKMVDEHKCPCNYFCTVATTCYEPREREHICYECWRDYCKENNIEIIYDSVLTRLQ